MSQKRLADLLGISTSALSKSLRGLRQGGVPRYIRAMILLVEKVSAEDLRDVQAQLDAEDRKARQDKP